MNPPAPTLTDRVEATSALAWTGERMVPEHAPAHTFWEHVYRYRFACRRVRGLRVLDIACGEGYGTAALSRAGAAHVVGVDVCPESCRHAAAKYHLEIRQGDAAAIPVPTGAVDAVVSFETIEHLDSPAAFLHECTRVLAPGGFAIISSPNRDLYRAGAEPNEFHRSEMSCQEFASLLRKYFGRVEMYSQCLQSASPTSIHSLAAFESVWLKVRGFWRVRRWALARLCDVDIYEPKVDELFRDDPVAAILAHDGPITRLMNPLDVRKSSASGAERAVYLVAVCRDPKRGAPHPAVEPAARNTASTN